MNILSTYILKLDIDNVNYELVKLLADVGECLIFNNYLVPKHLYYLENYMNNNSTEQFLTGMRSGFWPIFRGIIIIYVE